MSGSRKTLLYYLFIHIHYFICIKMMLCNNLLFRSFLSPSALDLCPAMATLLTGPLWPGL